MYPHRLALVITELDVGGAERCLAQVACGLDRNRFDPIVYALGEPPPASQRQLVEQLAESEIPVRFLDARSVWEFPSATRKLRTWFRQQQPQLVQAFLFHANVLATRAACQTRVPARLLGMRVADPSPWRKWLERRAAHRVQRVVCVSQAVAAAAARSGVAAKKLVVIPNGLDANRFPAAAAASLGEFGIAPGRQVILFVGRLHHQKGVDWLLSLAPALLDALPEHELLLVGTGNQGPKYETQARAQGVADRVHFAGWRSDVPEILRASQMLVLPSRWEGMPNALLEAMASRLPVVATKAEGVREVLGDLCEQQTVDFGDGDAFLDRVISIGKDPALASKLGHANRCRVEQQFSLRAVLASYEHLYESLIDER